LNVHFHSRVGSVGIPDGTVRFQGTACDKTWTFFLGFDRWLLKVADIAHTPNARFYQAEQNEGHKAYSV
jgi:hypothetical protein